MKHDETFFFVVETGWNMFVVGMGVLPQALHHGHLFMTISHQGTESGNAGRLIVAAELERSFWGL